ncbi:MAG: Arc family DNA-binding protein [Candidatus Thiothrix singaporensis]|uniref:Arc family DNA-binding protein n=1 Tax=Candidatus Thiothrix singaporensis TaxID=2799669 RepID=A0A7L6AYB1_9GAMM|nr:MAG: Arc family DNA-binding protein [Candidatus Thiothrix singaporensis]
MTETRGSQRFSITLSAEAHEWLKEQAKSQGRSLGNMAGQIITQAKEGAVEKAAYERGRLAGIQQAMNP